MLSQHFTELAANQVLANSRNRLRDPHGMSSLQFFDSPVEKKVRADFQPFGNRKQHRQRRLTTRAFEQRGICAGDSTAEGELFLGKVLAFPNLLENPPECHRCLAIACHGVTMRCTGLVLYGP